MRPALRVNVLHAWEARLSMRIGSMASIEIAPLRIGRRQAQYHIRDQRPLSWVCQAPDRRTPSEPRRHAPPLRSTRHTKPDFRTSLTSRMLITQKRPSRNANGYRNAGNADDQRSSSIVTRPRSSKPIAWAAAGVKSISRPRTKGPRSLIRTMMQPWRQILT
jgi:hypothetical protein